MVRRTVHVPVEMLEPDGGLDVVADDHLPRVSDDLDLSSCESVGERGISAVCPARRRRTAAHLGCRATTRLYCRSYSMARVQQHRRLTAAVPQLIRQSVTASQQRVPCRMQRLAFLAKRSAYHLCAGES